MTALERSDPTACARSLTQALAGWLAIPAMLVACAEPAPAAAPAEPSSTAATPPAVSAAAPTASSEAPAATGGSAAPPAAASSAAPAPEPEPTVAVVVKNIGMHIGGGPHDDATKAPIKLSVAPHFDAFAKCFAKAEDTKKGGDFGVDLRIERDGGKAKVTEPRTGIKGDDFKACVLGVFEAIDFQKPKGGATVVSYSLRFTPE